jgi:hypothetical protein
MEKILLALDPQNLSMNAIDFACYISRLTRSKLTGVFLENLEYEERAAMRNLHGEPTIDGRIGIDSLGKLQKAQQTDLNIPFFKEACCSRGVSPLIHRDRGIPVSETIEESRYADCIIVDPETSFSKTNEGNPGKFVNDLLLDSECPVIISPYSFEEIEEIIFTFNGSKSSLFAIKQFTYLFPELKQKKVIVVSVVKEDQSTIEDQFKMKEWLNDHYQEVQYVLLNGDPSDQLFGFLIEKKNSIVVMGAFGRGLLSRFIKPSHARLIMKTVNLPIFIAH